MLMKVAKSGAVFFPPKIYNKGDRVRSTNRPELGIGTVDMLMGRDYIIRYDNSNLLVRHQWKQLILLTPLEELAFCHV